MKHALKSLFCIALLASGVSNVSSAHSGVSEASALSVAVPLAVVTSVGAGASAASVGVVVLPAALSVAGATLVVRSVEASAVGVVCVLERSSDGARVSLDIAGRTAVGLGVGVGAALSVSVVASGAIITSAGEAIAFVPNALGRALTHHERL